MSILKQLAEARRYENRKQFSYMRKEKLPTQLKTKKRLCLRCGKKTFTSRAGCPVCGFCGPDNRIVTRDQIRLQLRR